MSANTVSKAANRLSLSSLLRFYLPMVAYTMIMMTSNNIINAGVSGAHDARTALAVMGVTMGIMNIFSAPVFSTRQMLIAMAESKSDYRIGRGIVINMGLVSLALTALVAFTPFGKFVFVTVFNTPPAVFAGVQAIAPFAVMLPIVYGVRTFTQSILITGKKTEYLTYSVLLRIGAMFALSVFLPRYTDLSGALIGITIWLSGLWFEAIGNIFFALPLYRRLPLTSRSENPRPALSRQAALAFLWPLVMMTFMWALSRPLINFSLTKTASPELALAVMQVAQSFVWIFMGLVESNLRQTMLIFGTSDDNVRFLKRFTTVMSVILCALLAVMYLTPIGDWALRSLIGIDAAMIASVKQVLLILIAIPLFMARSEIYAGLIMRSGNTSSLTLGKAASMATVTLTILVTASISPQLNAVAGGLGLLMGAVAESLVLGLSYRRFSKQCTYPVSLSETA